MNVKEQFMQKLIDETVSNTRQWEINFPSSVSNFVVNPLQVLHVYSTPVNTAMCFYVIQKFFSLQEEINEYMETTSDFIIVVSDNLVKLTISVNEVAEYFFEDLFNVIKNQTESQFLKKLM